MSNAGTDATLSALTDTAVGERKLAARGQEELASGTVIGRYVVLAWLGAGAMGVVYTAYDPELDRKVALKLLRGSAAGAGDHQRLLREAQSLAKLSHPNVVVVHDVGEHDGRVFLAMEFVKGRTLTQWLKLEQPRWPRTLDVFVRSGRGLVAAHEAGLVHRDFKPDNVMLGNDARARVMDFGLARVDGAGVERSEIRARDVLTRRGAIVESERGAVAGTPAYMAPEQLEGEPATATSDQFAFCVSLWEGLYGQRPFHGETLPELVGNVLAGTIVLPSASAGVPGWLRKVLQRGLAVDPERRWPSMIALLDALEGGRARARWRRVGLAGAGLAASVLGIIGWQQYVEHQRTAECEIEGASIREVWNDRARSDVRAAFENSGANHAAVAAEKVMPWLDAHADEWQRARTEACLDETVRKVWTTNTAERAAWCLDDRRMEVAALVAELSRGRAVAVEMAVGSTAGLNPIAPCLHAELLARLPIPDAADRAEIQTVREILARATAQQTTTAYAEGLDAARSALARAESLAWQPLVAASRFRMGVLHERIGEYATAEREIETAYFEGARSGANDVAFAAATQLVFTVGSRLGRLADAERWSRHALVALDSLPDIGGIREARHANNLAVVRRAQFAFGEAKSLHERVLAILESTVGDSHPMVADSLINLGNVQHDMGAYAEALASFSRALAVNEAVFGARHRTVADVHNSLGTVYLSLGAVADATREFELALAIQEEVLAPNHPEIAEGINNLAIAYQAAGQHERSKEMFERALAIWRETLGSDHPAVAGGLINLAGAHYDAGELASAKTMYEQAHAIYEQAHGPDHPTLALPLDNLAGVLEAMGRHDEAIELAERALAIREEALGADHLDVAVVLDRLGSLRLATGALAQAKRLLTRALAIRERALGAEHPRLATTLVRLAEVALAHSHDTEALAFAERALKLREIDDATAHDLAEARAVLAAALWASHATDARAAALAGQARAVFPRFGPEERVRVRELQALLDAHAPAN